MSPVVGIELICIDCIILYIAPLSTIYQHDESRTATQFCENFEPFPHDSNSTQYHMATGWVARGVILAACWRQSWMSRVTCQHSRLMIVILIVNSINNCQSLFKKIHMVTIIYQYFWIFTIPFVAVPMLFCLLLAVNDCISSHAGTILFLRADSSCRPMPVTGSTFVLLLTWGIIPVGHVYGITGEHMKQSNYTKWDQNYIKLHYPPKKNGSTV